MGAPRRTSVEVNPSAARFVTVAPGTCWSSRRCRVGGTASAARSIHTTLSSVLSPSSTTCGGAAVPASMHAKPVGPVLAALTCQLRPTASEHADLATNLLAAYSIAVVRACAPRASLVHACTRVAPAPARRQARARSLQAAKYPNTACRHRRYDTPVAHGAGAACAAGDGAAAAGALCCNVFHVPSPPTTALLLLTNLVQHSLASRASFDC